MAAAAGLFVASIYYNQPMLGILARDLGISQHEVTGIPVLTQAGYAAGLLFLAPLGDRYERRNLIFLTAMALAAVMLLAACATSIQVLNLTSFGIGLFASVAQQVVPMAVQLAAERERGKVVGSVMAGLLAGILLARMFSGLMAEYVHWRAMFALAGAASLGMGLQLRARLPEVRPVSTASYLQLMRSLIGLARTHTVLRRSGVVQGLLFASFVAFWANLALFLEHPPLSQGSTVAGALGLFGVAGVLAAPRVGKLADKGGQSRILLLGAASVAVSFLCYALFQSSMLVLIGGIVVMDIGLQACMISNQTRVYALDSTARSRLNTVYMTVMFLFGALGAAAGALAFEWWGWTGVCLMGMCCSLGALFVERRGRRLEAAPVPSGL